MFRSARIKSFHAVAAITGAVIPMPVGLREIPVAQITGSVGRAASLGPDFRPRSRRMHGRVRERYVGIERALLRGVELPPIEAYRVSTEYFVLDGHHRVAAAKKIGQLYVDAVVTDYLPRQGDLEQAMAQRHAFEVRTRLQQIELSDPAHYRNLLSQIEEHCWTLGRVRGGPVELPEAAEDWRANVYAPVCRIIEQSGLLRRLPGRTLADLYAYVSDHKWYESQRQGRDVGFAWAVADFAASCPSASRRRLSRVPAGLVRSGKQLWRTLAAAVAEHGAEDCAPCSCVAGPSPL